jgi:hypothetical protein
MPFDPAYYSVSEEAYRDDRTDAIVFRVRF